jgi:uncharacterized protein YdaU (DUF1376 family)
MSFAYMPLYTGDYLRDTRHLTPLRHGVYLLFLMHCWDQKGPLPLEEQECAGIANCRSADEVEALRYVLERFFVRMEDGWYNKRMTEEVAKAEHVSAQNRAAGLKSADSRAEIRRQRALNARSTRVGNLIPNPIPTPKKKKGRKKPGASAPVFAPPPWIPAEQWDAWIEMRKQKKKPPTLFALQLAVAKLEELKAQGHAPSAVLAQSAFNGWTDLWPLKDNA